MPRPSSWFDKQNNNLWARTGGKQKKKRKVCWTNTLLKYGDIDDADDDSIGNYDHSNINDDVC